MIKKRETSNQKVDMRVESCSLVKKGVVSEEEKVRRRARIVSSLITVVVFATGSEAADERGVVGGKVD